MFLAFYAIAFCLLCNLATKIRKKKQIFKLSSEKICFQHKYFVILQKITVSAPFFVSYNKEWDAQCAPHSFAIDLFD